MSSNEAETGATGHANANNNVEHHQLDASNAADLGTLIASLKLPGTPIRERCRNFRSISDLLEADENPPIREAVDAGLIPVLKSILTKTPSDWIFESLSGVTALSSTSDAGSSNKLLAASIWLPPLLHWIDMMQIRAAWTTRNIIIKGGYRDEVQDQGLLELLTKIQYKGRSIQLWDYGMLAVANFLFHKDLPLLDIEAARPAIRFLASSLKNNDHALNRTNGGVYHAICSFQEIAALGDQEYIQEMMDAGIDGITIGLMRDLMKQKNEDLPLWLLLITCISHLIHERDLSDDFQCFMDAGIVDLSMGFLRDWKTVKGKELWRLSTSWSAHLMLHSREVEHALAFINAGMGEFLPRLLQDDSAFVRLNGCKIVLAFCRSEDKSFMTQLLENGSVQRIFESASLNESDVELRFYATSVFGLFCRHGSDDLVKQLVFQGFHRPLVVALNGDLFDRENDPPIPEYWTEALDRVKDLIWSKGNLESLLFSIANQVSIANHQE